MVTDEFLAHLQRAYDLVPAIGLPERFEDAYEYAFHDKVTFGEMATRADIYQPLLEVAGGAEDSYDCLLQWTALNILAEIFPYADSRLRGSIIDVAFRQLGHSYIARRAAEFLAAALPARPPAPSGP